MHTIVEIKYRLMVEDIRHSEIQLASICNNWLRLPRLKEKDTDRGLLAKAINTRDQKKDIIELLSSCLEKGSTDNYTNNHTGKKVKALLLDYGHLGSKFWDLLVCSDGFSVIACLLGCYSIGRNSSVFA